MDTHCLVIQIAYEGRCDMWRWVFQGDAGGGELPKLTQAAFRAMVEDRNRTQGVRR